MQLLAPGQVRAARRSRNHFDAYGDITWDAPEFGIDAADPLRGRAARRRPARGHRLVPHAAGRDAERGARSLEHVASTKIKFGHGSSSGCSSGACWSRRKVAEWGTGFRYAYHEIIEEAHNFLDVPGIREELQRFRRGRAAAARAESAPGSLSVSGAGSPRCSSSSCSAARSRSTTCSARSLPSREALHPLLERVMRIHVTEEVRHLSFAQHYLRAQAPSLGSAGPSVPRGRSCTGSILSVMAQMMLKPSRQLVKKYRIPRSVMREANTRSPAHRAESTSLDAPGRKLLQRHGPDRPRLPQCMARAATGRGPLTTRSMAVCLKTVARKRSCCASSAAGSILAHTGSCGAVAGWPT